MKLYSALPQTLSPVWVTVFVFFLTLHLWNNSYGNNSSKWQNTGFWHGAGHVSSCTTIVPSVCWDFQPASVPLCVLRAESHVAFHLLPLLPPANPSLEGTEAAVNNGLVSLSSAETAEWFLTERPHRGKRMNNRLPERTEERRPRVLPCFHMASQDAQSSPTTQRYHTVCCGDLNLPTWPRWPWRCMLKSGKDLHQSRFFTLDVLRIDLVDQVSSSRWSEKH